MSNSSNAHVAHAALNVTPSILGTGIRRQALLGRSLAAVLTLGLLLSGASAQLNLTYLPGQSQVFVNEDPNTPGVYFLSMSQEPNAPLTFTNNVDPPIVTVVSARITVNGTLVETAPDPTNFIYDPNLFDISASNTIVFIVEPAEQNDIDDDGTFTIHNFVTTSDPNFAGFDPGSVDPNDPNSGLKALGTKEDADTAGATFQNTTLAIQEAGPNTSETYQVHLTSEPTARVAMQFDFIADVANAPDSDPNDFRLSTGGTPIAFGDPNGILIQPNNWDSNVPITVTVIDDDFNEKAVESFTITHTLSSADARYDALNDPLIGAGQFIPLTVEDDDEPGLITEATGGTTALAEGGPNTVDTYVLRLNSRPTERVFVGFELVPPGGDLDPNDFRATIDGQPLVLNDPNALVILPENWNVDVTVTLTVIDDRIDEVDDLEVHTMRHTVSSADPDYDALPDPVVSANREITVADNDQAALIAQGIGVGFALDEDGAPTEGTYSLRLGSEPTARVRVEFELVSNVVNDVDPNDLRLLLNGTDLITEGDPNGLIFTSADWDSNMPVTVRVIGDDVDEDDLETFTIQHTVRSTDPQYNALVDPVPGTDVPVSITETDAAGVQLTMIAPFEAHEGGANAQFEVVLLSRPSNGLVVLNLVDPTGEINFNALAGTGTQVQFTDSNWNIPQVVEVIAIQDGIPENDEPVNILPTINVLLTNSPEYEVGGLPIDSLDVTVLDDPVATNVDVNPEAITVNEGDPNGQTFTVTLTSAPPDPNDVVRITAAPIIAGQITVQPSFVELSAGQMSGEFTVRAVVDNVVEAQGTFEINVDVDEANTTAPGYNSGNVNPNNVSVTLVDDDVLIVNVDLPAPGIPLEEGATREYDISLSNPVDGVITITLDNDDPNEFTVTPSVTFAANTTAAQTVTVTAIDDGIAEQNEMFTLGHRIASTDRPAFLDSSRFSFDPQATFNVTITDNDSAGVSINPTSLTVAEPSGSMQYEISLDSKPEGDVTINLAVNGEITVNPSELVLNAANPTAMVTVTAIDDNIVDGTTTATITHTSKADNDPLFDELSIATVTVDVTDDDQPSIVISPLEGLTVNEDGTETEGDVNSYTITLGTRPVGTIQIKIDPDDQTSVSIDGTERTPGAPLTVTLPDTQGGAIPLDQAPVSVTVTVKAAVDDQNEGLHLSRIKHEVQPPSNQLDAGFEGLVLPDVLVMVRDLVNDADGDGLSDAEEVAGFAISVYIRSDSADGGLLRRVLRFRTDPFDADSDDDLISDFDEVVTFARFADTDGSVPGVPELGVSAARSFAVIDPNTGQAASNPNTGDPILIGRQVRGPGQEELQEGQQAPLPGAENLLPKRVWGVRTLASNDFIMEDLETQETLDELAAAGMTISAADTDGDGINDPDDDAPQFNPGLFGVENLTQAELLDFDFDGDGFPELGEGFPEISESTIEATRGIDYSNDGTLTDGFDFGTILPGAAGFRVRFNENLTGQEVRGFIGDGQIQSELAVVDTCPDEFNPDNDGDGIQDENPCQDAPRATGGCCGTPLGFSLMLPIVWTVASRRGGKRRRK